ncbi:major capsid protein [Altererythrobacter xixiisoli]|uniref:Major capsid protein n=1 Tax=Croceibacterium xixiisoli TaxID=1476466 RepID=A0A6I4TSU0_9SPHN|nr:major capsid protein [Croceibacterium xixiisoli]MXO98952.1 major capsid protein [Croceibacterium xixiisoli]
MPISMAIFDGEAFEQSSMITGLDKRTYIPNGLDEIIGFEPKRVTTDVVHIGQKNRTNGVIQTTLRGAPIEMRGRDDENARPIRIPRIAEGDKLFAHELAVMAPWQEQTEEDVVAARIAEMQEDLIGDVEMTEEHMRLGALNGTVLDKDLSTIVNYYTEFGIVPPSAIDLGLDDPDMTIGELREKIGTLIVMAIARGAGQGKGARMQIRAVCGDTFWFKLTGHPALEKTYLNYAAAAALREEQLWETFSFGGVLWFHYRGTDDGSTIAINTNQAKVFPYRLKGMFQHVMGAANEFLDLIHQPGRRYVPFLVRDRDRNQWVQPEIYAYPLFLNARPDLVLTATV